MAERKTRSRAKPATKAGGDRSSRPERQQSASSGDPSVEVPPPHAGANARHEPADAPDPREQRSRKTAAPSGTGRARGAATAEANLDRVARNLDTPLTRARGASVLVRELIKLERSPGRAYFSPAVQKILGNAARTTSATFRGGRPYIDARALLTALIEDGQQPVPENEKTPSATSRFVRILEQEKSLPVGRPTPEREAIEGVALPPVLVEVLIDAEVVLWGTRRRPPQGHPIHGRHIITAFLRADCGRRALAELGLAKPGDAFVRKPATALVEYLVKDTEGKDDRAAWMSIFEAIAALEIPELPASYHPHYDSDAAKPFLDEKQERLIADPLGVVEDARAMATLICLEDAKPPLAIGLFGDWGAGKSTFMEMLEHAIDETTERARSSRAEGQQLPFVERVAHIRFNAWHFMESELWASIATHIFRSLYQISGEAKQDWLQKAQLDRLIERLEGARAAEADAAGQLDTLNRAIGETRAHLEKIEEERIDVEKRLIRAHVTDVLTEIKVDDPEGRVAGAMRALGLGEHVPQARQLVDTVTQAQALAGRAKLLLTTLAGTPRDYLWYVGGGVVTFVAATALLVGLGAGEVATTIGILTGAIAWLAPHLKHINTQLQPLFDAHDRVMTQRAEREQVLAAEEEAARRTLRDVEARRREKEVELQAKAAERGRLEAMARGERPGELLARFIEDRAEAEDYRKHLGLIALVRQDFERMSTLMTERDPEIAQGDDLPRIDRIVLYIDDLDRCPDEQVVKVLEAVHLLLAFPLFVVVVGVDARWLKGALARRYARQFGGDGQATPLDYLEKIFQIPFWLRPLEHGEGGTYRRLLGDLVRHDRVDEGTQERGDETSDHPAGDDAAGADGNGDGRAGIRELTRLDVAPPEETSTAILERVTLTKGEIDVMNALGPLAGKSPRAVKRFVNLYRLIRVRKSGPELEAYLGNAGTPPLYPAMLLALAMETGLRGSEAEFLEALLRLIEGKDNHYTVLDKLRAPGRVKLAEWAPSKELRAWLFERLGEKERRDDGTSRGAGEEEDRHLIVPAEIALLCDRLSDQLDALDRLLGGPYPWTNNLRKLAAEGVLARYVFRR
jgi:hypothetical protein